MSWKARIVLALFIKTLTCVVHDKGTVGDGVPASDSPPLVAGLEHLQPVLTPLHIMQLNISNNEKHMVRPTTLKEEASFAKWTEMNNNDCSSTGNRSNSNKWV